MCTDPFGYPDATHVDSRGDATEGATVSTPPDPDPDRTPDLDSGLSEPEPRTSFRFPPAGGATLIAGAAIVVLFLVVIVAIVM